MVNHTNFPQWCMDTTHEKNPISLFLFHCRISFIFSLRLASCLPPCLNGLFVNVWRKDIYNIGLHSDRQQIADSGQLRNAYIHRILSIRNSASIQYLYCCGFFYYTTFFFFFTQRRDCAIVAGHFIANKIQLNDKLFALLPWLLPLLSCCKSNQKPIFPFHCNSIHTLANIDYDSIFNCVVRFFFSSSTWRWHFWALMLHFVCCQCGMDQSLSLLLIRFVHLFLSATWLAVINSIEWWNSHAFYALCDISISLY